MTSKDHMKGHKAGETITGAQALLSPSLRTLKFDAAVIAATVCVARAIFNTDAFITRE